MGRKPKALRGLLPALLRQNQPHISWRDGDKRYYWADWPILISILVANHSACEPMDSILQRCGQTLDHRTDTKLGKTKQMSNWTNNRALFIPSDKVHLSPADVRIITLDAVNRGEIIRLIRKRTRRKPWQRA